MERERGWGWRAWVLLSLGLGLRLLFLRHPNPIEGDPLLYANIARNLLVHGVYSFSPAGAPAVVPTLIRLPGYPLFLAACFRVFGPMNFGAVRGVQIAVDLGTCAVMARLAAGMFGGRAGLVALGLGCLCPFTANYTAAPLTETLTLGTIAVAYLGLWEYGEGRRLWVWGMGAALAMSLLLRPEQALLAVAVVPAAVWLQWRRGGVGTAARPGLVLLLCVVLPLVPWTVRNWRVFHVVQPLAPHYATDPGETVPLGFQRWYRSWGIDFATTEEVYWSYDGSPIQLTDLSARAFDSPAQRAETAALLNDYNETTTPTAEFDRRFAALARERREGHWWRYWVWLPVARLGNMLLRPRTELLNTQLAWWDWRSNAGQAVFALSYAGLNLLYLVAGTWGWVRARRTGVRGTVLWSMAAFAVMRCGLLLTLDNSEPRYTLELFPLLIVCAAGLAGTGGGVREGSTGEVERVISASEG